MNKSIDKVWNISSGSDVKVSFKSDMTIAKSEDDIKESDHVIHIQKFLPKAVKNLGNNVRCAVNQIGGKAMYATRVTKIAHEVGHWIGLLHPSKHFKYDKEALPDVSEQNVMHHPDEEWKGKTTNSFHTSSTSQVIYSAVMYLWDRLNLGSNKYNPKDIVKTSQLNKSYARTVRKYYENELIPKK